MRKMMLATIEECINNGDTEITDVYGDFETIKKMSDKELMIVYDFTVGFRG